MTMLRSRGEAAVPRQVAHDDVDIQRDRVLVARAQAGDRAAFDDLYARYYQRLWRFCMKRLGDEHEAEDVVQESFVRAWQALPGFGGERRFYPWISVIAAHACSNVVRKRNRSDPVADFADRNLASLEGSGEEQVMCAQDHAMAASAFAQLSPRHQHILNMREGLGWSYQVIAEHEGVRVTAVESLLWRARAALKREFAVQTGEGTVAGFFGVVFMTIRRWIRDPEVAIVRTSTLAPNTTSLIVSSATAAIAAIAGVIVPGPMPAIPPAASARPLSVVASAQDKDAPPVSTSSSGGTGNAASGWTGNAASGGTSPVTPGGVSSSAPPPSGTPDSGGSGLPPVEAPALPGAPGVPSGPGDPTGGGSPPPSTPDPSQTLSSTQAAAADGASGVENGVMLPSTSQESGLIADAGASTLPSDGPQA